MKAYVIIKKNVDRKDPEAKKYFAGTYQLANKPVVLHWSADLKECVRRWYSWADASEYAFRVLGLKNVEVVHVELPELKPIPRREKKDPTRKMKTPLQIRDEMNLAKAIGIIRRQLQQVKITYDGLSQSSPNYVSRVAGEISGLRFALQTLEGIGKNEEH